MLGLILLLFGAAAAVLHTAPPVTSAMSPVTVYGVPMMLGAWSGSEGAPEEILPSDPNERVSVRRTYRQGDRVAWISVALFVGQDNEARRGSINRIYPQRSVSQIIPVPFALPVTGSSPIALPAVIVHQDSRDILVAYWYQIGPRVYGSEYEFRVALLRDMILARRADSMLLRIATLAGSPTTAATAVAAVERLASELYAGLGGSR
jgi:EpsI family protein